MAATSAPAVSEPTPIIPDFIPAPAPAIDPLPATLTEAIAIGSEPHDAVPAALTDDGEASGAPPEKLAVLDGGSVKPATAPRRVLLVSCPGCGREIPKGAGMAAHLRHCEAYRQSGNGRLDDARAREAAAVREVAARAKEREAEAAALEDAFMRTREARARERANANLAQRRGEQG